MRKTGEGHRRALLPLSLQRFTMFLCTGTNVNRHHHLLSITNKTNVDALDCKTKQKQNPPAADTTKTPINSFHFLPLYVYK